MAQSASTSTLATVTSPDGLNLRAAATTTSSVLTTIPFASVVTITAAPTSDNWYPISFGSTSGWAKGDYLTAGSVDPAKAQAAPPLSANAGTSTASGSSAVSSASPASGTASAASVTTSSGSTAVATLAGADQATTGASYSATATYYGIDDATKPGQMMACGAPFNPMDDSSAATNDWPCGTHLRITGPDGRSILVTVADHGQYPAHWLDLTYAGFGKLADHSVGNIKVTVTVLQQASS